MRGVASTASAAWSIMHVPDLWHCRAPGPHLQTPQTSWNQRPALPPPCSWPCASCGCDGRGVGAWARRLAVGRVARQPGRRQPHCLTSLPTAAASPPLLPLQDRITDKLEKAGWGRLSGNACSCWLTLAAVDGTHSRLYRHNTCVCMPPAALTRTAASCTRLRPRSTSAPAGRWKTFGGSSRLRRPARRQRRHSRAAAAAAASERLSMYKPSERESTCVARHLTCRYVHSRDIQTMPEPSIVWLRKGRRQGSAGAPPSLTTCTVRNPDLEVPCVSTVTATPY